MAIPFANASFPEIYERALVSPLFRPFAELLLAQVRLAAGEHLLDVACGTGIVARLAHEQVGPQGKVVGVDVSAPMIEMARSVAPQIDWRVGNANALPVAEDERFDAVLCHQGLQFFPDRAGAVRAMARALRLGGRLAVSCWRPDEEFPLLVELRRIAERHIGPVTDRRHSFGDPAALESLLRESGLRDVRTRTATRKVTFEDGAVFARLNAMALLGMSASSANLSGEDRERLLAAIDRDSADAVRSATDAGGFRFDIGTAVAVATT